VGKLKWEIEIEREREGGAQVPRREAREGGRE